jgi:hypothetical protein
MWTLGLNNLVSVAYTCLNCLHYNNTINSNTEARGLSYVHPAYIDKHTLDLQIFITGGNLNESKKALELAKTDGR